MKSILNVKNNINLIKVISSCKICAGIKSQQEKNPFVIQYPFLFFSKFLFHFIKSLSTVQFPVWFLIDKPNESCKNFKKFEINALPTTEKAFKKKRKKNYNSKDICPSFTNFFRTSKSNHLNLPKKKKLKTKLGQLQCVIS